MHRTKSGKPFIFKGFPLFLAPIGGFEPSACRLGGGRSILLSYMGKNTTIILPQILRSVNENSCVFRRNPL